MTTSIKLGIVHVNDGGGMLVNNVVVQNGAMVTALNDLLTGSIGATNSQGSAFSASGNLGTGLAPTVSSTNQLQVTLNTSTAGSFAGTANLSMFSSDTQLAPLALTSSPISLTAQVNNFAQLAFQVSSGQGSIMDETADSATLQLGDVLQGSGGGSISTLLDFVNCPTCDPNFTDLLDAILEPPTSPIDPFSVGGTTSVTDLLGNSSNAVAGPSVTLDTSGLGQVMEQIVFDTKDILPTDDSQFGDDGTFTLTLEANLVSTAPPTVPEPGSLALFGSGLGVLFFVLRRRQRLV
jgi:hypothetical protein